MQAQRYSAPTPPSGLERVAFAPLLNFAVSDHLRRNSSKAIRTRCSN